MSPRRKPPTGKTFVIESVADFLNVPEHRLSECLREFKQMLNMARATEALLVETGKMVGITPEQIRWQLVPRFEWTDDGLGNVSLTIDTEPEATTTEKAQSTESVSRSLPDTPRE
jgi:diadenosine tetraphosphate (Ap4A) HIT family hydrolase